MFVPIHCLFSVTPVKEISFISNPLRGQSLEWATPWEPLPRLPFLLIEHLPGANPAFEAEFLPSPAILQRRVSKGPSAGQWQRREADKGI